MKGGMPAVSVEKIGMGEKSLLKGKSISTS
jgi:hypothetical protein